MSPASVAVFMIPGLEPMPQMVWMDWCLFSEFFLMSFHPLNGAIKRIFKSKECFVIPRIAEGKRNLSLHFLILFIDLYLFSLFFSFFVFIHKFGEIFFPLVPTYLEWNLVSTRLQHSLTGSRFVLNRRGAPQSSTAAAQYKEHSLSLCRINS